MNQIIEVPDIAVVKTVEGEKQLLSLRDQKIKKEKSYCIKFQGDLSDSSGKSPIENEGVTIEQDCITFPDGNSAAYLKYNVGDFFNTGNIFTISLEVRLNRNNPRVNSVSNRAPIFNADGDTLHTDPLNLFTVWVSGNAAPSSNNKEVIYACGIPDDPAGADPYAAYPLNEWHTLKLVWHYDTKQLFVSKDGEVLSQRWPSVTRDYNKRPTKIQFGWNSSQAKCYCSIRNFKITSDDALHNFGTGCGVKYQGDLYVLDSGIIPIVRMTTTKANPSFGVGVTGDIEIDWGDGVRETNTSSHTYMDSVESHNIVFYGRNTALTFFRCPGNQLTHLDVSQNTALTTLYCPDNQLTYLDVSQNTALIALFCNANQLTQLDVSQNTALKLLSCNDNQLTQLDLTLNVALTSLECTSNQLTQLDVSRNTALYSLSCGSCQLTQLDVSRNTALSYLNCCSCQLTQLDVSRNTALAILYCDANQLTQLDVSLNTVLTELLCAYNQLTQLNLSQNTSLYRLACFHNQLTQLDLTLNVALTSLDCASNQLTQLDLSQNTALTEIDCYNNQLTQLDVSENIALTSLGCHANPLITDNNMLIALANSLVDRTGKDRGNIGIVNTNQKAIIQSICNAKNWTIL